MKIRSIVALILAGAVVLSATACAARAPGPSRPLETAPASAPAAAPAPSRADSKSGAGGTTASTVDRMVIRTAQMEIVVTDVDATLEQVSRLAQEMGGFVVSSESRDQAGNRVGRASIRVASDRLDEALVQIGAMSTKVNRRTVSNKDVTEEYVDQDARLRTLKATESQYLELMKTARTTEDIIKVRQSLTQVQTEIEQTQARLQYLQRSTELALITIDIVTPASARPVDGQGWRPTDTVYEALQGLVAALMALAAVAIWAVIFVPIWVPAVLLIRWWRRRGRRGSPSVPPAQPTAGPA